jgi:hypothetical protein
LSESAVKLTKADILRQTARRYLADVAFRQLLGTPQPAKLRQVMKSIEVEGVTTRLLRDVMAESDRFESVDRRWAPAVRYGDTHRPFERVLSELIQSAGVPVSLGSLAQEMAQVYSRDAEYYEHALPRILSDKERFFRVEDGNYGLASWLLIPTSDVEDDIIFDNFLSEEQVREFSELCPSVKWEPDKIADAAAQVVKKCKEAIPARILALFAWRELGEDFDAVDFYSQILADDRIVLLSDQRAYPADAVKDWTGALKQMADELAALPMEAEEEEAEGPVTVTDTDKEEIVNMILDRGSASAEELLDAVLEVGPDESSYAGALESLNQALQGDERVMYIGDNRWSKVIVFPEEVKVIPESLVVPEVPVFETPEGDVYDQELEVDGFEGDLKSAIYDPLAEDVTDEDPARTMYQANGDSQRCVLKYHHKTEGTFPMCQIAPDFFGTEPEIIPIVLIDEGKRKQAFVNNSTRLIYGLKDLYKGITEISGSVFYIERTAIPGEFRFRFDGEMDEQLGIDTGRSLELLDLRGRYESQDMPLFDVVVEILEHKPGMTFPQLVNEVNIVRRCSRLLIASILSSYHCFTTKGKSGQWRYDEKKRSQGFNKTKRKYVKK